MDIQRPITRKTFLIGAATLGFSVFMLGGCGVSEKNGDATSTPEEGISAILYNDGTLTIFSNEEDNEGPVDSRARVQVKWDNFQDCGEVSQKTATDTWVSYCTLEAMLWNGLTDYKGETREPNDIQEDYSAAQEATISFEPPWCGDMSNGSITCVRVCGHVRPVVTCGWFAGYSGVIEGLENLDTSRCVAFDRMFSGSSSTQLLDVSDWDTSAAVSMVGMFSECPSLQSLDVSNWDTSSVVSMKWMFWNCPSLQSLDVSIWDTSSVINMGSRF